MSFFDVHDRFAAGDSLDGDDDFYEFSIVTSFR